MEIFRAKRRKYNPTLTREEPHTIGTGKGHKLTFALTAIMGDLQPQHTRKGGFRYGVCTRTKGFIKDKNESRFQPYEAADRLFRGSPYRGLAAFFLLKDSAGTSAASFVMIVVMLPCFLMAMYEKHGQPLEVVVKNIIQTKFVRPKERPYQTQNLYAVLEKQRKLEKEVSAIVKGNNQRRRTGKRPRKG